MANNLVISTLNVRGINDPLKRHILCSWMKTNHVDILALQETYLAQTPSDWSTQFPGYDSFHSFGTNHSRDVSFIVKRHPDITSTLIRSDPSGRSVTVLIRQGDVSFYLTAVYVPVQCLQRTEFLSSMSKLLSLYPNNLVCGDFNCVFNHRVDRMSLSTATPRIASHNAIHSFIKELDLVDIYRKRNSTT